MDEVNSFALIKAQDKEGFISYAQKHLKTARGEKPTKAVASRWYGFNEIILETSDDIWIHRDGQSLYWTKSINEELSFHTQADPFREWDIVITEKPCTGWSSRDLQGRRLNWNALHPKARDFLSTESTFQKLNPDYGKYAKALVEGDVKLIQNFHDRLEWKTKEANSKQLSGKQSSYKEITIKRLVYTTLQTCKNSRGQLVDRTIKNKEFLFQSEKDLEEHLSLLWDKQEAICALTGLKMIPDGMEDGGWHRCSLDRIDSDGNYEAGNLQLVCMFANKWKSDMSNETFLELIKEVKRHQN